MVNRGQTASEPRSNNAFEPCLGGDETAHSPKRRVEGRVEPYRSRRGEVERERYERSDREPEFAAVIDDCDGGDSGRETAHRPAQLVAARHAATALISLDDAYPRLDTASIMSAAS